MSIFNFFTDQVLGMKWLSDLTTSLVENVFNLDITSKLGGSIQFFIYDTIKIFILLGVLIFLKSYIQSYFPPEKTKKILTKFKGISGATVSALLGTVTPFCSCSSIPIFIGFTNAGLPLGVTFSFLISSPMVDLASLLLLASFFGMNISVLYVVLGLIIAVVGGTIISKLNLENEIQTYTEHTRELYAESENFNQKQRLDYALNDTKGEAKYLQLKGWTKCKQPKKPDGTKYTGREFCALLNNDISMVGKRVIAHIGGHHVVCIKEVDDRRGYFKIHDTWNSTDGCIGNYWIKNA